jgi:hypothetical protein
MPTQRPSSFQIAKAFALLAFGVVLLPVSLYLGYLAFFAKDQNTARPTSLLRQQQSPFPGGTARFTLKLNGLSSTWDIGSVAEEMERIANHEVAENQPEGTILFEVVGNGEDLYGNTINEVEAFEISYSMDDLRRVNWSNYNGAKLLNLGTIVSQTPAGKKMLSEYCAVSRENSELFCNSEDTHE